MTAHRILPEDEKSVCRAADQGNPLVKEVKGSKLSKAIKKEAADFDSEGNSKKRLFSKER